MKVIIETTLTKQKYSAAEIDSVGNIPDVSDGNEVESTGSRLEGDAIKLNHLLMKLKRMLLEILHTHKS